MRPDPARLRVVAAELLAETSRIRRTVDELPAALARLDDDNLALYATAALLETFYTGVEKAIRRAAATFGGLPDGPEWHRQLLTDATLDVPDARPAILRVATAAELDRFLAFRHRFRNLYLFDLDPHLVRPLAEDAPRTLAAVEADLRRFASFLRDLAAAT